MSFGYIQATPPITAVITGTVTVSGTVAATQSGIWNIADISGVISLPTGASTALLQTAGNASLALINASLDVALSTRASEATLSALNTKVVITANGIKVDGTATIQPVSGPLTDTQLRATPVPVSGTVTANAGTNLNTSLLALASTQTDKSQFTKITDGTDTALVTSAGEQNVLATAQPGVDIGDVTVNNATGAAAVNIQDGGNSITVDGAVTVSGTVTANPTTYITELDEVSSTVNYIGIAVGGTATSAAAWQIKKLSVTGTVTSILLAGGSASFTNIWDNRASLSYS